MKPDRLQRHKLLRNCGRKFDNSIPVTVYNNVEQVIDRRLLNIAASAGPIAFFEDPYTVIHSVIDHITDWER